CAGLIREFPSRPPRPPDQHKCDPDDVKWKRLPSRATEESQRDAIEHNGIQYHEGKNISYSPASKGSLVIGFFLQAVCRRLQHLKAKKECYADLHQTGHQKS